MKKSKDRVVSGVCGGIGEYTGIDSLIVRIVFIAGIFSTHMSFEFICLYIILSLLMEESK